jgi:hypothetical protein
LDKNQKRVYGLPIEGYNDRSECFSPIKSFNENRLSDEWLGINNVYLANLPEEYEMLSINWSMGLRKIYSMVKKCKHNMNY